MQVIEQRLDTSVIGKAKSLGITEVSPAENTTFPADADWIKRHLAFDEHADGLVEYDLFESIYNPGKMLLLTSWKTPEQSDRWTPLPMPGARELRHRRSRNVRDYGMFERGEATQYFPDAKCPVQAKA